MRSTAYLIHVGEIGLGDETRAQNNVTGTHSHPRIPQQGLAPRAVHVFDGKDGDNDINDTQQGGGQFWIRHIGLSKYHCRIIKASVYARELHHELHDDSNDELFA
eukprot:scaffold2626_cov141-Amphora_coffeaeformis.AAC.3